MKTSKGLLYCVAWLAVLGYGIYTTDRIRQLEETQRQLEGKLRQPTPQLTHAFDASFIQHFGQPGVDAVDRVLSRGVTDPEQLAREVALELKPR